MTNIINNVISYTWPMIVVSVVIISTLRITYLIKHKIHFVLYKELFYLVGILYILELFQIVTTGDVVSWSTNNFIPFREIFRYKIGSRLFLKNVVGNIILFAPFGFLVSYFLDSEKKNDAIVLTCVASLTIEIVQMSIGRVFDVDDIILNTLGGFVGYECYSILRHIKNKVPKIFKTEVFLDILVIILLLGVLSLVWYN